MFGGKPSTYMVSGNSTRRVSLQGIIRWPYLVVQPAFNCAITGYECS